jgi:hypothetical protein
MACWLRSTALLGCEVYAESAQKGFRKCDLPSAPPLLTAPLAALAGGGCGFLDVEGGAIVAERTCASLLLACGSNALDGMRLEVPGCGVEDAPPLRPRGSV